MAPRDLSALQIFLDERSEASSSSTSASKNSTTLTRNGNIDQFFSPSENQEIQLCHLFSLFPFTDGDDKRPWNKVGFYEGVAAMMLALHHLNTGDPTIISELQDIHRHTCPGLRFSLEIVDTALRENVATEHVIQATNRPFDSPHTVHPCGFVGAARSAVSIPTSIITGLKGYPQISPISTSSALNDKILFPLFARTIPSDDGTAVPLVLYFRDVLKLRYLAVIHINDSYGNSYAQGIQTAALELAPDLIVQSVDIPVEASAENIERAVNFLRETEFAYIFSIVWRTSLFDAVLEEAYRQGIAGTGIHNWIFSEVNGNDIVSRPFRRDSPISKALVGSAVISASPGLVEWNPKLGILTRELQEIKTNPTNLEFIREMLPKYPGDPDFGDGFDVFSSSYLESPGLVSGFLYDATIAMGVSACQTLNATNTLNGIDHYRIMVERTNISGTSGLLTFDSATGTRNSTSAFFQLQNYLIDDTERSDVQNGDEDLVYFKEISIELFSGGRWQKMADYVFNDGTTNIPADIPPNRVEPTSFSPGIRIGGLVMCGLTVAFALGFALWTWKNRAHRVLMASQPIFLYIICAGVLVVILTIVPLNMDEHVGTVESCNVACNTIPWLLSMGFSLIFSALFTKTWRINKIFSGGRHLRRVTLKPWHVAQPMFCLMGANVIILLFWTFRQPLFWDYEILRKDNFGRPLELYGFCNSHGELPYLISLSCLNLCALAFALSEAYRARHISTQYAETEYIFLAMIVMLIVCLLGIPVLVLARENPDAYFFVFSGILFIICNSVLLLIFIPKVYFFQVAQRTEPTGLVLSSSLFRDWFTGKEKNVPGSSVDDIVDSDDDESSTSNKCSDDTSSKLGLKILSKKSKRELIFEVTVLRKQMKKYLLQDDEESTSNQFESRHLEPMRKTPSFRRSTSSRRSNYRNSSSSLSPCDESQEMQFSSVKESSDNFAKSQYFTSESETSVITA